MEDDLFNELDDMDLIEENVNELDTLVGPNGKFKTVEELAKGKLEADKHIARLQAENAAYRQKVTTATTLESVMEKIKSELGTNRAPEQLNNQTLENQNTALDDSKIKSLVSDLMNQTEAQRKVQANREAVQKALLDTYGTEAQLILNKKAKELNISLEYLRAVADESPNAFYRLIELNGNRERAVNTPQSSVNVTGALPNVGGAKGKSYYDKLKQTDPKKYFSDATRKQQMEDAMKLGEAYFNT